MKTYAIINQDGTAVGPDLLLQGSQIKVNTNKPNVYELKATVNTVDNLGTYSISKNIVISVINQAPTFK